jgi:Recombinase
MAELLKLRQAARLIGVSPGRLYRAITDSRLAAAPGGGPGKPTLVSLEAVQTFCRSEGLRVPDAAETLERPERSMDVHQELETLAGQYLARIMERQSNYFDLFLKEELTHLVSRVVEQVVERLAERFTRPLERSERAERPERSRLAPSLQAASTPASAPPSKADVVTRIRTLRDAGLSLQQIADLFNAEALPTLSGKGRWQKGTIGNLLTQAG